MERTDYTINEGATLYAVKTLLPRDLKAVTIGKLGTFDFPQGVYVYVGSAKRNIESRIARHIQIDKKFRWHFDYLRPYVQIADVQTFPGEEGECRLFHRLMREHGGTMPVKGLGSSDCKCFSHLFYTGTSVKLMT